VGADWARWIESLKTALGKTEITPDFHDISTCLKSEKQISDIFDSYLGDDPVFGRVYQKGLKSLFDIKKLSALQSKIKTKRNVKGQDRSGVIILYGTGAALGMDRSRWDILFYADLTRQEVLKRNKKWSGLSGKTQSISPKKLYYVDFQVNDSHRNRLLHLIDCYVDGNRPNHPICISGKTLRSVCSTLASQPLRLKPIYEPGPWGGQWLKQIRHLPKDWVNCAWSFEVIAQEMSLNIAVGDVVVELPWTTFFHLEYEGIMGNVPKRRFRGEFPIRYDYLDTMDGGDLSIQVHPTTPYIKAHFNEPYHQGEMYYIVDAKEGARVNLGLKSNTKKEDFHRAAHRADIQSVPFDYHDYVNNVPVKKHDLLLIPPGTVHGSGKGNVVLEISATTYRYTFKIYDHLRPDLNGVMRPIHIRHAFNVIKWFRRSRWVDEHLRQESSPVRSGDGWAEYLIGDRKEFFHVVFRLDFNREIEDDTKGQFHIHTLVEGTSVLFQSKQRPENRFLLHFSETLIIPACMGKYRIINQGDGICRTAKARLR